jgi:UDP-N-acetylmuramoylalanine--D-glutamate ligase
VDLAGKKVVVLGTGKTGLAVTRFLARRKARVFITDNAPLDPERKAEIEAIAATNEIAIESEFGGHSESYFEKADLIVPSPGVPRDLMQLVLAAKKRIPILSEIELAARFVDTPMIACTGTNGKSTTVSLIGHLLNHAGLISWVGGNLGTPLIEVADAEMKYKWLVVEVSSFQLEWIKDFRAVVALLLNLTEDHLERYRSVEEYYDYKTKIFANQPALAVYNQDDSMVLKHIGGNYAMDRLATYSCPFSLKAGRPATGPAVWYEEGAVKYLPPEGGAESYSLKLFKLPGEHNIENAAAAIAVARFAGASRGDILSGLAGFRGLPHRVEPIGPVNGVMFYNDSKGTNTGALAKALAGFETPVVLIAGGRDKGGDLARMAGLIGKKVKALVLIGEAAERMQQSWGSATQTEIVGDLTEAVKRAAQLAGKDGTVLFSPACSSFDMFSNYKERGDLFRRAVQEL